MKTPTRKPTASRTYKKSATTDFVSVAIAYAEEAIEDRKGERFGQWVRLGAKRFISDLKRTQRKRPPFLWSADRANHACQFIERLPHVEGTWATPTIQLQPFQVFFIVQLFGFRTPTGARRFTTALLAIARKNAKSTLAASILLYSLCCENEPGPQLFAAGTTGDQARIVWRIAKSMVERTPDLTDFFGVEAFANTIVRYVNSGTFRPINAKASTQDGLNPSALCFDELHAHKTHDLLNVLMSAAGARANPLFLYTTTEGYETPGPWPEVRSFAQQVLQGLIEADHFLALIFALDPDDKDFDSKKWIKASPLLASNPLLSAALEKEAIEARSMPGKMAEFRIKRLNRQSATATGEIDMLKWKRCAGPVPLDELIGLPCKAAFDLAATTDMNAACFLWKREDNYYAWVRYWVPTEAVHQRTERRTVPYASWVEQRFIKQTEGDVADYETILADLLADCERFQPSTIAYDPWNATQLAQNMQDAGLELVQFRQGGQSYNPGFTAFERAYISGHLCHGGNPVLTWNMANLVARRDANLNRAPDKKRSADKIDGAVCVLMAFSLWEADVEPSLDGFLENPIIVGG